MDILDLSPEDAACLVPLNLQVQAIHAAKDPERYVADPDPDEVAIFLQRWLETPGMHALVAGSRADPIGYTIFEIESRAGNIFRKADRIGMLHHLGVDANVRRQGIGSALIRAVKARVHAAGADTLWTGYAAFNTASAAVMASEGLLPRQIRASCALPGP